MNWLAIINKGSKHKVSYFQLFENKIEHEIFVDKFLYKVVYLKKIKTFLVQKKGDQEKKYFKVFSLNKKNLCEKNYPFELNLDFSIIQDGSFFDIQLELDLPGIKKEIKVKKQEESSIRSPITGKVIKIYISSGLVKKGDVLLIIDAMKMENKILASQSGSIKKILVKEGDLIKAGDEIAFISA